MELMGPEKFKLFADSMDLLLLRKVLSVKQHLCVIPTNTCHLLLNKDVRKSNKSTRSAHPNLKYD